VNLKSDSPLLASSLALNQLDIAANMTGPVVSTPYPDSEVTEGDNVTNLPIVGAFADPDGDTVFYSLEGGGLPVGTGFSIDPLTGEISGTPTNEDSLASPITVTVTATDGAIAATDIFTLTVVNANDPPTFTSVPVSEGTEGIVYTYLITTEDIDGDIVTITGPTLPAWLTLTDNGDGTATLSGTPGASDAGDNPVQLQVSDGQDFATQDFTINVLSVVNNAPSFTSNPNLYAVADSGYSYSVSTDDPDADAVTITAPTLPVWLVFVDNGDGTASLSGTPGFGDIGSHAVSLQVSDGEFTATQSFSITVVDGTLDIDADGLDNVIDPDDDGDGLLDEADEWPLGRFDDVDPATHFAFFFIETLERSGITGGCGGGGAIYCPDDPVTRAQMAVFLERGINGADFVPPPATGTVFADVGVNDFAAAFIERLFADGITGGCGGGNYCPSNSVTRAQMAVFLLRAKYGASYTPPPATGCGSGNYCPADPITRAQMAVFLVRTFGL
jgi:hypothetical protein